MMLSRTRPSHRFQSTPSARRATLTTCPDWSSNSNFNPRPPRGGRLQCSHRIRSGQKFQSTPSARRATSFYPMEAGILPISIHALREEGDFQATLCHEPLPLFQSTPSARRATAVRFSGRLFIWNFNPRPPRGGRHASLLLLKSPSRFQSTPSARRATLDTKRPGATTGYFNPRPPRGGRHGYSRHTTTKAEFQSTPSARRATVPVVEDSGKVDISIHALREEGDEQGGAWIGFVSNFNPRPPRGGRPQPQTKTTIVAQISIHALREEGDPSFSISCIIGYKFQSTPSARRATISGEYYNTEHH